MNVLSMTIDAVEDTECEKCHKETEDAVSLTIETTAGTAVIFLCQECISDAVTGAIEDGTATEMLTKKDGE